MNGCMCFLENETPFLDIISRELKHPSYIQHRIAKLKTLLWGWHQHLSYSVNTNVYWGKVFRMKKSLKIGLNNKIDIRHYDNAVKRTDSHNAIKAYSSVFREQWPLSKNTHTLQLLNKTILVRVFQNICRVTPFPSEALDSYYPRGCNYTAFEYFIRR